MKRHPFDSEESLDAADDVHEKVVYKFLCNLKNL